MLRLVSIASLWNIGVLKASSPTVDVATYVSQVFGATYLLWAKITDDNSNLNVFLSPDGQNWVAFQSIARTDYLADPDQVLWGASSRSTLGHCSTTLVSWEEA